MQNQPTVVSITGVPMIVRNKDVNGDYMPTELMVNGYPVFGKINPQNDGWSSDRLCIRMDMAHRFWSVNPSSDAHTGMENLCQIMIPSGVEKSLEALAQTPGVIVSQLQRRTLFSEIPRERHFFRESRLTLKSPASDAANAAAASKHERRQQMLHETKECYICAEEKLFGHFRVPRCGHACCERCYKRWFASHDSCATCKQPLKDSNGNDQSSVAWQHPDDGLLFVREDDEAGAARRTDAGFQTHWCPKVDSKYVVRSAAGGKRVGRRWVAV